MEFFHNRSQNLNLNSTLRYEDSYVNSLQFNGYQLMRPSSVINDPVFDSHIPSTPPHLRVASPKTPPTVIRRRSSISSTSSGMSSSSTELDENKLQPFTTYRLKPISQKVKSMVMTLTERGLVCLEFLKVKNGIETIVETFTVSQDGQEISIMYPRQSNEESNHKRNKAYSIQELPERFHKKYEHARKFVTLIQSKTPKMTLTERGLVCLEFLKVKNGIETIVETFTVSQDGQEISIMYPRQSNEESNHKRNKAYSIQELPERFHKKYDHARKFVTLIQSKTPKVTMYNQQAKCMLMENAPIASFEVQFYNGRKIINNWSGMKLVDEQQGSILSLSSPRIQQQFSNEIQQMIKFAEQCQQQCVQFEALIKSTASCVDDKNELFPVIIGKKPTSISVVEEAVPFQPKPNPVNISTISSITSSSCSSYSSDTGSSVIRQIRVPNIGLASQLDNGDIWVEFEDGSHLGIKPTVTTVTYINHVMTKYRKSQPLPDNVKAKLASVPIVLEQLMTSQKAETMSEQSY
ncbi:hypothetical protein LOTGIDRAFT_157318 [Lottia gigantea]|uniref:Uncharacterized protein n=1 Tax=Lottia gigantea TaxID=225164 RepID=V4ADS4_LOTGI|nr:hypothetical protein LOTGIDRAFT_157318 [Lottia gigantea]ESP02164.1 hypothetical protein LOTGIDRAFT_157318 [Lottia gigantea]